MVFTNDGRRNEEVDAQIGKANTVLREVYRSVFTELQVSNTAQTYVFK